MTSGATTGLVLGTVAASGFLLILVSFGASPRPVRSRRRGSLRRLVVSAGLPWLTTGALLAATMGISVLAAAIALVVSALPVMALIVGLVASTVPFVMLRRRANQAERAIQASWPEAIDALVSGVRAGLSLDEALGALAVQGPQPLRPAMSGFIVELRATGSFADSLRALQERLADPTADRVVACLLIARDVGGTDLGRVLRNLSALLRDDARTRAEIEGRQSWTVSAARLAVAAPWITVALLCTRPGAVEAYRTGLGAVVLTGAAVVSVIAYRLMIRIGRLPQERRLTS